MDGLRRYTHARVIIDFKNMADHMKSELAEGFRKKRKRRQERLPQDYKRHLRRDKCWKKTEKREENDSGLTQNKFVHILFAQNPCVFI